MGLYALLGALLSGPVWLWIARRRLRRRMDHVRLLAARTRQQGHLAELGTLTGGLAHEIKNPLSTIKVNLQLLVEDIEDAPPSEAHGRWLRRLQSVADEVSRVQEVLEDFLRFAGKHELQLAGVDLREVLDDLVTFFTPQAENARVRVRTHYADRPLAVRIDVDLIKQALLNLLINGQQAMPDGGELIVKAQRVGQCAQVEVIDTGVGMSAEVAENIFHAYYTTKPGGTGLGLPTAQRIVREHQGRLSVDTAPGTGTRFVVELPLNGQTD